MTECDFEYELGKWGIEKRSIKEGDRGYLGRSIMRFPYGLATIKQLWRDPPVDLIVYLTEDYMSVCTANEPSAWRWYLRYVQEFIRREQG